jgi:hypothetical protein
MKKSKASNTQSKDAGMAARLELIRNRHRELILQPRELVMGSLSDDAEYSLDEMGESEELELVEARMGEL